MIKKILILLLLMMPLLTWGDDSESPIALEKADINIHDQASILRGAKFFAQTCMTCHTIKYLEHDKLAQSAGITLDKMPLKNKEWWLNVVPPDLSAIGRVKGADWLYTYFHSFYKDPSRPTGYNNLLAKDINMMNVFAGMQGEQNLIESEKQLLFEHQIPSSHYYTVLKLVNSGTMTPDEFDETITDLVNFLMYASDPEQSARQKLGVWVLLFLMILFVLALLLKILYWKNVK